MKKLILDHDLGSDCDDAAALAILVNAHLRGECRVLAVTHAIGNPSGAYAGWAVCDYLGADGIPFGRNQRNRRMSDESYEGCTREVNRAYFARRPLPALEENVRLLRRVLAGNGARDVTLVTTGPMITMQDFLQSGPDDISEKTGLALYLENVAEFVLTGGNFVDPEVREWNLVSDLESAQYVVGSALPRVTFVGNELGGHIQTGACLEGCDPAYPVRECYRQLNLGLFGREGYTRWCWDLISAYYALHGGDGLWERTPGIAVRLTEDGRVRFTPGGGSACLRQRGADEDIRAALDAAVLPQRHGRSPEGP